MNSELLTQPEVRIDPAIRFIRAVLLLILVTGLVGMGAELLLMDHFEDFWMVIPLLLIGISLLALVVHAFARSKATIRLFQVSMFLMMLGGAIGTFLHHQAKEGFQLEGRPSLEGIELFWEAMRGTTPPSLAPAALIQTGLLGLAWAYRHPSVMRRKQTTPISTGDPS